MKKTYGGTIVDVLNNGEAYTVELLDDNGETVLEALLTEYLPGEIILVRKA